MTQNAKTVVYRTMLPLNEMVAPAERFKIGDRVVSKYDGEAGVIWDVEDFECEQNVGVIFDFDKDTLAWMGDEEVRMEPVNAT